MSHEPINLGTTEGNDCSVYTAEGETYFHYNARVERDFNDGTLCVETSQAVHMYPRGTWVRLVVLK